MKLATFTHSGTTRIGVVDGDEVVDLSAAAPELPPYVNDELRQESNTKQLIFDCFYLVEHISKAFTLKPGDIIATGTPGGAGLLRKPPVLLKDGDVVRIEIDGIGQIENPVIDEPADAAQ